MASWHCKVAKFPFTLKLSVGKNGVHYLKQPACQFACLSNLMVVTVSLSDNVSQKSQWVIAPQQGWPGMTPRQALGYLCMEEHEQCLPTSVIFFPCLTAPWFSCIACSAALLAVVTLPATSSEERSHHVFLICLILLAILFSFVAYCWGRL